MSAPTRLLLALALLLLPALATIPQSQVQEFPTGQLIEQVRCRSDASQSYALFLPSNYTTQRRWPILYALDAGARGRLPVERFRDAAEAYGYIIAGSNNSRNGPMAVVDAAIRAVLDDTRSRFAVDNRRVYFAGFSGGARVAVSAGSSLAGGAAGVVGCGAGFPEHLKPAADLRFAYFGTAGIEDFAFPEMRQLDRALDGVGVPHRFAVFQGAHDWPPNEVCTTAIEWMELRAMRSGLRATEEPFVDRQLQKTAQQAVSDEASGRIYDAFLEFEAIVRDYAGLRDVTPYQRQVDRLRASKALRQGMDREREEQDQQDRWMSRLMGLKSRYTSAEDLPAVLLELNTSIASLNATADGKADSAQRLVARRVRSLFLVQLTEAARDELASSDYAAAAFSLSLAVKVRPDNSRLFYNLACAYALGGRKGDAISALKRAVAGGFTDVAALETDRSLDALRSEAAFQALLDSLKKE